MKILFQGKYDLFTNRGGDTNQIEKTAEELRKMGVEVDIATKVIKDLSPYDLVHIFQLDWIPEPYLYAKEAKRQSKKIVLSPIHHAEYEVKKFDDSYVFGFRRLARLILRKQEHRDILKNIYRSILDFRKLKPTLITAMRGFRKSQKEVIQMSEIVLVQTEKEAEDLKTLYNIDFKWRKIPCGVSDQFIDCKDFDKPFSSENYILCAARIEPRKNQLSIIDAVSMLRKEKGFENTELVFIGKKSPMHREYVLRFEKKVKENSWIKYYGFVEQGKITSYFHFAKVCVSASWFETTGLTLLEALFCGTNVVAAGDRAREILGEYADYCEPSDVRSICEAIRKSFLAPRPKMPESFSREYTWESSAKKTLEVYNKIL